MCTCEHQLQPHDRLPGVCPEPRRQTPFEADLARWLQDPEFRAGYERTQAEMKETK